MSEITLMMSFICHAYNGECIGTKVRKGRHVEFNSLIRKAITSYDSSDDRAPGQHFIMLPPEATNMVTAGVGRHTHKPEDYVVAVHRNRVDLFLNRAHAVEADSVAVVVYTKEAYLADPDDDMTKWEIERVQGSEATHVIVAVLAFAGPKNPLSRRAFVHNLAGNNTAYNPENTNVSLLRTEARDIESYHNEWCVVADPTT